MDDMSPMMVMIMTRTDDGEVKWFKSARPGAAGGRASDTGIVYF